jgi:hypothetical protein
MYSDSTLHINYFRCYGPQRYNILSSDPKYEMVGKNTAVQLVCHDVTM